MIFHDKIMDRKIGFVIYAKDDKEAKSKILNKYFVYQNLYSLEE